MPYKVSAVSGIGTAISVIVETAEQALEKLNEYREDGFAKVAVRTLDGKPVDLEQEPDAPAG